VAGYIRGPQLIRELMPSLLTGIVAAIVIVLAAYPSLRRRNAGTARTLREIALMSIVGIVAFAALLTIQRWPEWQQAFFKDDSVGKLLN
jgi:ABC-type nickel/cobalt efflux system permease component RcnA